MASALEDLEDLVPGVRDLVPDDKRRRPYERRAGVDEKLGPVHEPKPPIITRSCLRCSTRFETRSRFLRLCDPCRKLATHLHTPFIESW